MLVEESALTAIRDMMSNSALTRREIVAQLSESGYLVKTEDGTLTLRSSEGTELMHSRIGAMREAFEKFAGPSGIGDLESPRVLDLCSGLGYNSLAALVCNENAFIDMIEYSRELIYLGSCLESSCKEKVIIDRAIEDFLHGRSNQKIQIFCGDARAVLRNKPDMNYDIVFHDGFSPGSDPVLYSVEFLSLLRRHMSETGILLSYSSSIPFRSSLIQAGFHVGEGPSVGRKRGITIATLSGNDTRLGQRLSPTDEKLIALATVGTPFRDPDLTDSSEKIQMRREREREQLRSRSICLSAKKIRKDSIDREYDDILKNAVGSRESVQLMNKFLLTNTEN